MILSLTFGILPIYQEWAKMKLIQSQLTIYKPVFQESWTEKLKWQQYFSSRPTPFMVKKYVSGTLVAGHRDKFEEYIFAQFVDDACA